TLRTGQPETPVSMLTSPNPNLRFKRGTSLDIAVQNELSGPALMNWHGLDGAPAAEPLTGQLALPGGAKANLAVPLRHAGTLVGDLGLLADGPSRALPLIVEESEPQPVDRDEVLLIEDFRLRPDGTAVSPGTDPKDATTIYAVNGLILPD